ncbi:hypothetical protein ACTXT7_006061 [Hymenolepis weldensis]
MADVADSLNTTFLAIGISVIAVIFTIFIYFKFFCSRRKGGSLTKSSQKKAKKPEKKSNQPATKASKSPAKSQPQPQKVATPARSPKVKEVEAPKEQILATTDEEDWVKVKPAKSSQIQAAKPAKSPKQENQPKKNQQQQQEKKAEKAPKKIDKVERKNSSSGSSFPSYVIPPSIEKPAEEEWQEITSKKKKPRARKDLLTHSCSVNCPSMIYEVEIGQPLYPISQSGLSSLSTDASFLLLHFHLPNKLAVLLLILLLGAVVSR